MKNKIYEKNKLVAIIPVEGNFYISQMKEFMHHELEIDKYVESLGIDNNDKSSIDTIKDLNCIYMYSYNNYTYIYIPEKVSKSQYVNLIRMLNMLTLINKENYIVIENEHGVLENYFTDDSLLNHLQLNISIEKENGYARKKIRSHKSRRK